MRTTRPFAALFASIVVLSTALLGAPGAQAHRYYAKTTKLATGNAPGLDLVIYGLLLIIVIGLAPRGIAGLLSALVPRRFRLLRRQAGGAHRRPARPA